MTLIIMKIMQSGRQTAVQFSANWRATHCI